MSDDPPDCQVVAFMPRPRDFEKRLHRLADDSRNIKWSQHARDRMRERDISIRVALHVLRSGVVSGPIIPGKVSGEWKAKVVLTVKGRREVGVVAIAVRDSYIIVKTVEWEDVK